MSDVSQHPSRFAERALEWTLFLSATAVVVYLCLLIVRPFVNVIAWSSVLVITVYPLHRQLVRKTGRVSLSAFVCSVMLDDRYGTGRHPQDRGRPLAPRGATSRRQGIFCSWTSCRARRHAVVRRRTLVGLAVVAISGAMPLRSRAQSADQVATMPPNVVLANYDNVPVGPFAGLEGSAYVARVSDPSATWFNPAGLSRLTSGQISGSAGVYQWTTVSPQALPNSGGSRRQLPNVVGFAVPLGGGITAGAAFMTTNSWTQEVDSELIRPLTDGAERVGYSADSQFARRIAAAGAGYQGSGPWRVGAGFALSLVDLRLVQGISDRIADTTGLRTLLVAARASGSALQIRAHGGVQYDAQHIRFGAAIRTPGLTIRREGTVTLDGTLDLGQASLGASLFDGNARFEYHLPWELQGGVAYIGDHVGFEADVQGYTPIAAYPLLATDQPTLIYGDAGAGGRSSVISRPFDGLTSASHGVVNVAVGGSFRLWRQRDLRVHGGFATSRSPVDAADEVFNAVDLSSWSVGVSGTVAKLQFAVGVNYRVGVTSDLLVRNLLNGDPLHTKVNVRTGGLVYSLAYQF